MNEMFGSMASLGQDEREDASVVRRDDAGRKKLSKEGNGVLHVRWTAERTMEENEGMMMEDVMRDGVKRGVFRVRHGPDETLDFGKHMEKTIRRCISRIPVIAAGRSNMTDRVRRS